MDKCMDEILAKLARSLFFFIGKRRPTLFHPDKNPVGQIFRLVILIRHKDLRGQIGGGLDMLSIGKKYQKYVSDLRIFSSDPDNPLICLLYFYLLFCMLLGNKAYQSVGSPDVDLLARIREKITI
jgi:hypothetical protein